MTSQKLYELLKFLETLDKKLNLQPSLEAVKNALTTLASQPAQPQHQNTLANALAAFGQAAAQLGDSISPSQFAAIQAIGGGEFFDPSIAEKVRTSVEKNAMTPSVAKDFVQELATRREQFIGTVRSARQSLEALKITASPLQPGSADLAFLIPREIFDNELAQFAKELTFLGRLLQDFSEAQNETEPVKLEQLSSSVPTIALAASAPVIAVVAFAVNKFLEAWERIEKIRKIRGEITDLGMKGTAVDEFTEQIETTVTKVVEEATEEILLKYKGTPDRRNELANAIHTDTRRLFGQIERGLTVEFRAEPAKAGDAEQQKALTDIANLARVIQFPEIAREPLLLKGGEILEGDIKVVKHTKKTTTQKTAVPKKAVQGGDAGRKE